jgi:hypothetical protein
LSSPRLPFSFFFLANRPNDFFTPLLENLATLVALLVALLVADRVADKAPVVTEVAVLAAAWAAVLVTDLANGNRKCELSCFGC